MFQNVDAYAGDPILSLMEAFQQDPRADKVNLSIGLYYNEQAIIPQLEAVRQAADRLQSQQQRPAFICRWRAGALSPRGPDPAVWRQSSGVACRTHRHHPDTGGSGALKVGADFLKRYFPDSAVWVSDPTWRTTLPSLPAPALRYIPILVRQRHPRGEFLCSPPSSSCRRAALCCFTLAAITRRGPISPASSGIG